MKPLIVSYSDFSAKSVHGIQPKFEALKSYKRKRKYREDKLEESKDSIILTFEAPNKFSPRPLFLLDSNERPEKTDQKTQGQKKRPCTAQKARLDNTSDYQPLDWNFKPLSKHREQWLFSLHRPESDFTPKVPPKKIPISLNAINLKNTYEAKLEETSKKLAEIQSKIKESEINKEKL